MDGFDRCAGAKLAGSARRLYCGAFVHGRGLGGLDSGADAACLGRALPASQRGRAGAGPDDLCPGSAGGGGDLCGDAGARGGLEGNAQLWPWWAVWRYCHGGLADTLAGEFAFRGEIDVACDGGGDAGSWCLCRRVLPQRAVTWRQLSDAGLCVDLWWYCQPAGAGCHSRVSGRHCPA